MMRRISGGDERRDSASEGIPVRDEESYVMAHRLPFKSDLVAWLSLPSRSNFPAKKSVAQAGEISIKFSITLAHQ